MSCMRTTGWRDSVWEVKKKKESRERYLDAGENCRGDIGVVEEGAMEGGEEEKQIAGVGAGKSVLEEMNGGLQTDGENALGEIDLENEQTNEQQHELAGEKRIVGAKHVLRRHLDDAREEGENGLLFLKMKRIEREKNTRSVDSTSIRIDSTHWPRR